MVSGKTILIAPLDWGLGHASRCVQIIEELAANNKIVIGVSVLNRSFFESYFPDLLKAELPSYTISYSKLLPVWLKILLQWPAIRKVIKAEKKVVQQIIKSHKINYIISDNRFGLYDENTHSVFITHQLTIKAPFLSGLINGINRKYIHAFHEVWVPDYENKEHRLSGTLSDAQKIHIPVNYIGPKSALMNAFVNEHIEKPFDYLILLSGVEPQRTLLESMLLQKFSTSNKKVVLVRGSKLAQPKQVSSTIQIIDFACGVELKKLIVHAERVICRSGYSSLMDLHLLQKKKLILIPTPGQTEQEYLAKHWESRFGAKALAQNEVSNYNFSTAN